MFHLPNQADNLLNHGHPQKDFRDGWMSKYGNRMRIVSIWLTLTLILAACSVPPSAAQFIEDFESNLPTWERHEADCIVLDSKWLQRRSSELDDRNKFERIAFEAGYGSKILVAHNVPPSFLIPELTPSVRIKASRSGIQMMVRVVLPETPAPNGAGPMTVLLNGPTYHASGQWQTLSFEKEKVDLKRKLRDEIWLMRQQHGSQVSANNAYVDKVVLNLYCSPGQSWVQIDDLKLTGMVDATAIAKNANSGMAHASQIKTVGHTDPVQEGAAGLTTDKQPSLVVRDGTVLLVDKRPFLARVVQHRGESFEFLKSLGFNVMELNTTATYQQLDAARQLDLWIVCPPPSNVGLSPISFQYDRVLAWSLGEELEGRNLQGVQQRVREIQESDQREGRPILAHVSSHWTKYAQLVDILNVGLEPLGTSFLASQYSEWIKQRSQTIEHNKPVWADIQTDFPPALVNQIRAITQVVPPTPIEPQQMRFLVYEAITGGARGLRFKSRTRLDGADPTTRLRAMTIEWINSEMVRLEPWIAGGVLRDPINTGDRTLEVNVLSTNRSRLLLLQRPTHYEQYLAGDTPLQTIRFQDPDTTFSERAMLISDIGLQPLAIERTHGGNEIRIDSCPYIAAIVLTQDPLVTNRLNQSWQRMGQASTFQLHIDLTRQWLAVMQLIEQQMVARGRSPVAASSALSQATTAFQNFNRMLDANSQPNALPYLNETDQRLAVVRRELITEPLDRFRSKSSTPLLSHVSLVPLHWELATRLSIQSWNPNGLPAGDFESLQHLTHSGWENRRLDDERVATSVELSVDARVDGHLGLKLEVVPKSNATTIDAHPLWIKSPKVPVRVGQIVRIHGWVNVPQVVRGNIDGLMIVDSLGGEAMAERIPVTSGWQEFTLYRSVPHDADLTVTFTMTGFGVAWLDEVTIRTVDLPSFVPADVRTSSR